MFEREWGALKRIRGSLFGGAVPAPPVDSLPVSARSAAPALGGQFSAELRELVIHHLCQGDPICLKAIVHQFEKEIISYVLGETHWNQKKAAEILGIKHTTLNYWVRHNGLAPGRRTGGPSRLKSPSPVESGHPKNKITSA